MAPKYEILDVERVDGREDSNVVAANKRGDGVSNGVFVFGMFTKDDPVTWEIHVPVHSREW